MLEYCLSPFILIFDLGARKTFLINWQLGESNHPEILRGSAHLILKSPVLVHNCDGELYR